MKAKKHVPNNLQAVFFDLDGTLLDTAPDLYSAMLKTLSHFGHEPLSFQNFRPQVHTGAKSMILKSFGVDETYPEYSNIREVFLNHYQQLLTVKTDYFPGIPEVLDYLDKHKTCWGIVTNKPGCLTEPLMQYFELDKRSHCVISGDSLTNKKPHPEPLLHACELTQTEPGNAIYVGDTEMDIQAAKAAGMGAIAVLYGYRQPDSRPEEWNADYIVESPLEIIDYIDSYVPSP